MDWFGVSEREPLVLWVPTADMIRLLKMNLRGLSDQAVRQVEDQSIDDFLQSEQWVERREKNLVRLEACGERAQYLAMYPDKARKRAGN